MLKRRALPLSVEEHGVLVHGGGSRHPRRGGVVALSELVDGALEGVLWRLATSEALELGHGCWAGGAGHDERVSAAEAGFAVGCDAVGLYRW